MKSNNEVLTINFELLSERLLVLVNSRVENGDFSERGLARIMGVSQPQIHNVLKGARALRPPLADRFLRKFGITVLELVSDLELKNASAARCQAAALKARSQEVDNTEEVTGSERRWRKPATRAARLSRRYHENAG